MTWEEFASKVRTYQIGFMGEPNEVKPGRGEFHENPDSCICQAKGVETNQNQAPEDQENNNNKKDAVEMSDEQQSIEEDPDWTDIDYLDNAGGFKELPNLDSSVLTRQEQPEVEEFFSD